METNLKKSYVGYKKVFFRYAAGFKKIPWVLGKHAFLVIVLLVVIELFFGAALFAEYVLLPAPDSSQVVPVTDRFRENTYKSVMQQLQARENASQNIFPGDYQDPFK